MPALAIAAVAGILLAGAVLIAGLARRPAKGGREQVPPALRPGDTDDTLESDRLNRVMRFGVVASVGFAAFITVYWVVEPGRMDAKTEEFAKLSVERGKAYFHRTERFIEGAQIRPAECSRCHGDGARGGTNEFVDPISGIRRTVRVPELQTVFSRYKTPPPGFPDAAAFIRETIERGRPGTDMPVWGQEYGGPLTSQTIDDLVSYLKDIQRKPSIGAGADGSQIFAQFCSPCHGQAGAGGSGPAMTGGSERVQFPRLGDHLAFVMNGSKPGQRYGTSGQGTGGMPPWGKTLSAEQIRAVVDYERSL